MSNKERIKELAGTVEKLEEHALCRFDDACEADRRLRELELQLKRRADDMTTITVRLDGFERLLGTFAERQDANTRDIKDLSDLVPRMERVEKVQQGLDEGLSSIELAVEKLEEAAEGEREVPREPDLTPEQQALLEKALAYHAEKLSGKDSDTPLALGSFLMYRMKGSAVLALIAAVYYRSGTNTEPGA